MRTTIRLLAVLVLLLATGGCVPLGAGPLTVTALLDDTAGLFVGNDVGVLGVKVGQITAIEPRGPVVAVELEIEHRDLPASAGAVVVARSVATDRYLELTPAFADGPRLADGATIPLERTRTPVEFDDVLATLRDFSRGLRGKDGQARSVRRLLSAGSAALDGRGADINATLADLATAAGNLSDQRGNIVGTIDELDQLTTLLVTNEAVVDEFITSVTDATDLFADERNSFGRALTKLSHALTTLARFARENRRTLAKDTAGLTRVVRRLMTHEQALAESVELLPVWLDNLGNAVNEDDRLDVRLPPEDLSPTPALTAALCALAPADLCDRLSTEPDLAGLLAALLGGTS